MRKMMLVGFMAAAMIVIHIACRQRKQENSSARRTPTWCPQSRRRNREEMQDSQVGKSHGWHAMSSVNEGAIQKIAIDFMAGQRPDVKVTT